MKQISHFHSFNKLFTNHLFNAESLLETHNTDELNPDFAETLGLPEKKDKKRGSYNTRCCNYNVV
jgi:hypothetical protein